MGNGTGNVVEPNYIIRGTVHVIISPNVRDTDILMNQVCMEMHRMGVTQRCVTTQIEVDDTYILGASGTKWIGDGRASSSSSSSSSDPAPSASTALEEGRRHSWSWGVKVGSRIGSRIQGAGDGEWDQDFSQTQMSLRGRIRGGEGNVDVTVELWEMGKIVGLG
jgi:hypothetical protein